MTTIHNLSIPLLAKHLPVTTFPEQHIHWDLCNPDPKRVIFHGTTIRGIFMTMKELMGFIKTDLMERVLSIWEIC